MRILFPFVGDNYGGSHASTLSLIEKLRENHSVDIIIGLHEPGYFSSILDQRGFDWCSLPKIHYVEGCNIIKQLIQMFLCIKQLSEYIKKLNIDIVHTNDRRMHLSWLLAAKVSKASHIWHQRSAISSGRMSIYMLIPDAVVTISSYCRDSLSSYARKRTIIIDNPVTLATSQDSSKEKKFLNLACISENKSVKNILFVGNWLEQKRPLTFVRSAKYIIERYSKCVMFTMVGEERQPMKLSVRNEIFKLGLESSFRLVGAQSDMLPWYKEADLVVAPAMNEGLGRTLIEASILGIPVIASRHGGHLEIIKNGVTGTFFEPDDPSDLADKVINFFSHEDQAHKMALVAKNNCLERFSPSVHANKVYSLYKLLMEQT